MNNPVLQTWEEGRDYENTVVIAGAQEVPYARREEPALVGKAQHNKAWPSSREGLKRQEKALLFIELPVLSALL